MLKYLKISGLAIIDKVEVEFRDGFNVLTGETGAGKSILIGALDLLLGSRGSSDIIRTGEEEAQVEGLFEIPEGMTLPIEPGSGLARSEELILSRRVSRSGKSRCLINGDLASVAMLQRVGRSLVSIFGQHEHQVLLDPEEHVEILDRFGELEEAKRETSAIFAGWTKAVKEMAEAEKRREELEQRGRENAAAIEELSAASLREGEEDELIQEREVLKKAVQIREKAFEAHQTLYSRSGSLMEGFAEVKKALEFLASTNPKLADLHASFEEAVYRIEDVALELRSVAEMSHSDPKRLEQIEERLAHLRRLKRKHGEDLSGLIRLLGTLSEESGDILEARADAKKLMRKVAEYREKYLHAARNLSVARRRAAGELEAAMKKELKDLAMPNALFEVSFRELEDDKGSAGGLEKIEFFLASNPGEAPRPLSRVASGGELSRIMLAVKALQVDGRGSPTVIFDEVDAGIGGHTAFAVGTRLARVAQRQQVLCVTHLHQIAALADHHLSVQKYEQHGRTHVGVTVLDRESRVGELARMLGASPDSVSVREHVQRLMESGTAEVSG
ncbi:MAG: DNA repair protein RecN [Desulfomonilaceae bacterium]